MDFAVIVLVVVDAIHNKTSESIMNQNMKLDAKELRQPNSE